MTVSGEPRERGIRHLLGNRIALWAAFVMAHLWLGMLGLYAPGLPLGDVTLVYRYWVDFGFTQHVWVGIHTVWVYPIVALVPMLIAWVFGPDLYASTWLSLVMLVDAVAFAVILAVGRRHGRPAAGWWWVAFLVALGPVAVGRIDAIAVAVAIVGILLLARAPRLATVLLTVAAWIKVWPAALVAAAVVALRSRFRVVAAAVLTSAAIAIVALLLGSGTNLLSFVTQQADRGIQVESVVGTPWMWDAAVRRPGGSSVYYDTQILTYQVLGPGIDVAAAVTTPILAVVVAALLALGIVALRRGRAAAELLAPLALALTTALIVFNKVGSPQFVTWLAVPVVFGLVTGARGFRVPAVLALAIAGLTQGFYPYLYWRLVNDLDPTMLAVLTARNVLYVALFAWAVAALARLAVRPVHEPALTSVPRSLSKEET